MCLPSHLKREDAETSGSKGMQKLSTRDDDLGEVLIFSGNLSLNREETIRSPSALCAGYGAITRPLFRD